MKPRPTKRRREGSSGRAAAGLLLVGLLAVGCARYHARPISPDVTLTDFQTRRLDARDLAAFLVDTGAVTEWPPAAWDLHALTLAAFYYSPDLDVARARWGVARGGVVTAGGRPNPSLTGAVGYNATTPADEVTPWIPEAILDLPIEVAGKRGIRIREARQLSEAARLNIYTAAWQVRARVRRAYLDLYAARVADSLYARQQEIQTRSVRILEQQLAVGEVSAYEVSRARSALVASRFAAMEAVRRRALARSELATAIGVPPAALTDAVFSDADMERVSLNVPAPEIRRRALTQRSDILGALAEYEASQAVLQLEIRKQYPDISLGPGYQLDQTDAKWTLALTLALPVLNRNQGPIAEAEARRQAAAAHFLSVQSGALAELEGALVASRSAVAEVQAADTLLSELKRQERSAEAAYRAGQISRLELLGIQSEMASTALSRLDALVKAQEAIGTLEDATQSPLDVADWVLANPRRNAGKEEPGDE